MSLTIVRLYVECALLLLLGAGLFHAAWGLAGRGRGRPAARLWLEAAYCVLLAAVALPLLLATLLAPDGFFPAPMQVWSRTMNGEAQFALALTGLDAAAAPGVSASTPRIDGGAIAVAAAALLAASLVGLGHLALGMLRLRRLCRRLTPFREVGRVSLCVAEPGGVAFSAWLGRRVYVAVPMEAVLEPARLRMVLAHELRHIRARDTGWAYLAAAVRALFPWHPAAHAWVRLVSRLQELACDQQLLARGRWPAREYGDCLVWAAERAQVARAAPVGAVPMVGSSAGFLARRIELLLSAPAPRARPWALASASLSLAVMTLAAALSHGAVADRRLSRAQVQELADRVAQTSGFRVPVDETMVAEVNRVVGSEESRRKVREALVRMQSYRPMMLPALERRGVPAALLAVPLVESRYEVLPEATNRMKSAGLWQFIPAAARRFGLRVDATVDERLDPPREVEAAAAYLARNHAELRDWPLAIAAYNSGEARVRHVLTTSGTRDLGALVQRKLLPHYASAVLAAVLLIHEPRLVE